MLGLDALELDGDLLAGDDVGTEIDVTEAAATDLTADAVLVSYTEILLKDTYTLAISPSYEEIQHVLLRARREARLFRVTVRSLQQLPFLLQRGRAASKRITPAVQLEPGPTYSGERIICPLEGEEREYKPEGWISTWKRVDSP